MLIPLAEPTIIIMNCLSLNSNKLAATVALFVAISLVAIACAKVPFTDRRQAKLLPNSQINTLSFDQYQQFLSENPPLRGGEEVNQVRRVGNKLVAAVQRYYTANGLIDDLKDFEWEFNVVDDPLVNAFCMPGGKVVIYTGILPICQDEDGLAVVMGHEIAHALAHHGNERLTQQLGAQGALLLGNAALTVMQGAPEDSAKAAQDARTRQVLLAAAGVGAQVGILLPFSRKHESEADQIGLYLMAISGYDLNAAVPFWQRMEAAGGQAPPEFLSTHPSPGTRQANLEGWIPEAREMGAKY